MLLRGTEHLILWIYAKNKKFQPYTPKWLFYHLENGLVPEAMYFHIIKKPYLEPIKKISDARKKREELLDQCENIGVDFRFEDIEDNFEHFDRK